MLQFRICGANKRNVVQMIIVNRVDRMRTFTLRAQPQHFLLLAVCIYFSHHKWGDLVYLCTS